MEVSRPVELARIQEIKILNNVRLINRHDLNPVYSKDNLHVQFEITGEIKGRVTCHLCLDGHDMSHADRNFIFPLFVESMNILIGRQITLDKDLSQFDIHISPPKLSIISQEINTSLRLMTQKYDLELEDISHDVLVTYNLEAMN